MLSFSKSELTHWTKDELTAEEPICRDDALFYFECLLQDPFHDDAEDLYLACLGCIDIAQAIWSELKSR